MKLEMRVKVGGKENKYRKEKRRKYLEPQES